MGMKERSHGNRLGCLYNYIYGSRSPSKKTWRRWEPPDCFISLVSCPLPFWQMSASNFLERYRNKRAVPSTSKRKILLLFFFFLFFSAFTGSLNFPFRVILARWFREPIPQSYHHLFFFFFSKENLAIKGSKAKKKTKKGFFFHCSLCPSILCNILRLSVDPLAIVLR